MYPLNEARRELSRIQAMGVDEFKGWQQTKAWQMVRFHHDNNALYRKLVGETLPDRWDDLPIVTKKDLQQPLEQMVTKVVKLADCHVGNTSGSTGIPFFYAKDKMTHAMTWAIISDRYSWYDIDLSSKQARFYGMPKEWQAQKKEQIKDTAMNRVRFSVFDLSDEAMHLFLVKFRRNKFKYVYGYTNALVMFARYLLAQGITLSGICPTLKVCISTSETCTPEDDVLLRKAFGIQHIREYGISETCLTAFDATDSTWRMTEETLYTEIVDEHNQCLSNGLEGRVLSTSLYNTALPMIRYETGDMGIVADHVNDKYRSLHKLSGRVNDTVLLPNGKKAAGLTFYYISRSVLESSGVLKEFIIRQVALDKFVFDVVADRNLTGDEVSLLKEKTALYLAPGLDVIINRVDRIERPASGKLKHFYSELI